MVDEKKKYGLRGVMPGIAPETEGAPVGVPGGNDGADKTRMTGKPVSVAQTPPPVSADLEGVAPQSAGPAEEIRRKGNLKPDNAGKGESREDNAGGSRVIYAPGTQSGSSVGKNTDRDTAADEEKDAVIGYDRQIAALRAAARRHAPETERERRERERKERSRRIIGSVSDGLSALSNLWFTSQYAPDMFDPDKGQLKPLNERIGRMKAERERDADRYLQYALKIGDLQNGRAGTLRAIRAQREQQRLARAAAARAAARDKREEDLHPDKKREAKGRADAAEHKAGIAKLELDNKPTEIKLKNDKIKSETNRNNRPPAGRGGSRGGSGGSGGKTQTWYARTEDGKVVSFQAKSSPHAENVADGHGWELMGAETYSESTSERSGHGGRHTSTRRTKATGPAKKEEGNKKSWSNTSKINWK